MITKFVLAVVAAVFAGLEVFGVSVPDDIKQQVSDNTNLVVSGLAALALAWPGIAAAVRSRLGKSKEGGFVMREMVFAIAIASTVALLSGCAAFQKDVSFEQKLGAALVTTTTARTTCADLYDKNQLAIEDARACLFFTDHARKLIDYAHLYLQRGEQSAAEQALEAAQKVLVELQKAVASATRAAPAVNPTGV